MRRTAPGFLSVLAVAVLAVGCRHRVPPPVHPDVASGVAGVVYDSVARTALAGASVEFADATHPEWRPTILESGPGGEFKASLPTGRYFATFVHPRLDELGVAAPTYVVTVPAAGGTWLDLAIPSPARMRHLYCGESNADSSGTIVGRVFEASTRFGVGQATVAATWNAFTNAGVQRVQLQVTASADGSFALCGLPPEEVTVDAWLDARRTDEIPVRVPKGRIETRDLVIGERKPLTIKGVVLGDNRAPIPHAHVSVRGSSAEVTADDVGAFALRVPQDGTVMLQTRAIGYAFDEHAVNIYPDSAQFVEIELPAIRRLDTVHVAAAHELDHGFADRRNQGSGTFFTRSEIEAMRATTTLEVLRHAPMFSIVQNRPGHAVLRVRGSTCLPMLYIDRFPVPVLQDASELDGLMDPAGIRAIEMYAAPMVPREFSKGDPCAVIVVWTRK